MSVLEPDDPFDDIVAGLDLSFDEGEVELRVDMLDTPELVRKYNSVRSQLKAMHEEHYPKTQAARDLHSQRVALMVELRNRGL